MMGSRVRIAFLLFVFVVAAWGRRHTLTLKNDIRRTVLCSHFGFLRGSYFSVFIEQLVGDLPRISFTLDKSGSAGVAAYLESNPNKCFRGDTANFLYVSIDMLNSQLVINNKDPTLSSLVFEAGVTGMDDEKLNSVHPTNLLEAVENILNLLMLTRMKSR
ncbi:hypothetical protein FGIG_05781 [Fasciola gigantica]|uniref:Uncharacterized protein n=1 Tax=Fasciola gigantica TaxID=46835 RepID=A0A504Y3X1_FASGI|nr:hypothetical protein FGIG_05781 [Fasciola gigantica]